MPLDSSYLLLGCPRKQGKFWFIDFLNDGNVFKVKMVATVTYNNHYCACLGHLGQNRNDPICVTLPKVAKASSVACTINM